jgi:hypothetical protein
MDCFRLRSLSYGGQVVAEFIIGPAEGRTRWLLAMTDDDLDYFFRISSTLYGPPPDVVR